MFKQLNYQTLAETLLTLLHDDQIADMGEIEACFTIILRNTQQPKWRYKTDLEFLVASPLSACKFKSAKDYLFDVTNTRAEVTQEMLVKYLRFTITNNEPNTF